jgi:tetratricopeptide (TPR) repeat protein
MSTNLPLAISFLLLFQAEAPSLLDRLNGLDDAAAARVVAAEPAATREALGQLLVRVDASVHSDRQRPEQRRVRGEKAALALGVRVGSFLTRATGDHTYERRFRAREQRLAGTIQLNERHYREALTPLTTALREAQALGDLWLETITRVNLAYAYLELGRGPQALAECERAAEVSKNLDDRARGLTIYNLGSVHLHLADFERSIAYSREAVALSRKAGIRLWEGNSLLNLGAAYHQTGDLDAARDAFESALAVLEKTSDKLGLGRALYNLGLVAARQHRYSDAAAYMERALPLIRTVDIRHSHAIETGPEPCENPYEVSALEELVDAYSHTGDELKAAAHRAMLRRIEPCRQGSGHTHPPH